MQIYNNHTPNQITPNFKAIKSIECKGLYKKYSHYSKDLYTSLQKNVAAMDFCKKYDVDIVFDAKQKVFGGGYDYVISSVQMLFNRPVKKRFLGFWKTQKDEIKIASYYQDFDIKNALENATRKLKNYISESRKDESQRILDRAIKFKEESIQDDLINLNK